MNTVSKYVPALRLKGAEIDAVRSLDAATKSHIQPLFEFVPKDFQSSKEGVEAPPVGYVVRKNVKILADNWGWKAPFFVDFLHLAESQMPEVVQVFNREAMSYELKAVLVTPLVPVVEIVTLRNLDIVKAHGLCIRINVFEFRQGGFNRALIKLVETLLLAPAEVDLIVDFSVNPEGPDTIKRLLIMIPINYGDWRSITVLGGSFPKNLTKLEKNEIHDLPRVEWLGWRRYFLAGGTAWFGDYTIQHGIFEESEGKGLNFSASIRYTGGTDTVVVRGERVNGPDGMGYEQYPANAQLLCLHSEFCGKNFSAGDRYIQEMSEQQEDTGGPKQWLYAGINHHLTFVVHQITHIETTADQAMPIRADEPDWPARFG